MALPTRTMVALPRWRPQTVRHAHGQCIQRHVRAAFAPGEQRACAKYRRFSVLSAGAGWPSGRAHARWARPRRHPAVGQLIRRKATLLASAPMLSVSRYPAPAPGCRPAPQCAQAADHDPRCGWLHAAHDIFGLIGLQVADKCTLGACAPDWHAAAFLRAVFAKQSTSRALADERAVPPLAYRAQYNRPMAVTLRVKAAAMPRIPAMLAAISCSHWPLHIGSARAADMAVVCATQHTRLTNVIERQPHGTATASGACQSACRRCPAPRPRGFPPRLQDPAYGPTP